MKFYGVPNDISRTKSRHIIYPAKLPNWSSSSGFSPICDIWHLFSLFLSYLTILMIMLTRKGDFRKDEIIIQVKKKSKCLGNSSILLERPYFLHRFKKFAKCFNYTRLWYYTIQSVTQFLFEIKHSGFIK